mgnify:FL=1|tara:strand:+ start:2696 stop:3541 length:846 start_codon:yes stop_codon:yes gene_type:complete
MIKNNLEKKEPLPENLEQLHTSCRECIFSVKEGQTQVGCEFDRIDLYKENGSHVIEAYDEFDNEFFVINNRYCLYRRTEEWAEKYSSSDIKSIVEKQVKPRYHAIVFSDKDNTLDELSSTLESLSAQYNPPSILTVCKSNDIDTHVMMSFMSRYDGIFEWSVQQFLATEEEVTVRQRIDFVLDRTKSKRFSLYIVFDSGFVVPESFSLELQDTTLNKMIPFAIAKPKEGFNGMIVSHILHKKHAGNCFGIHLEDKVKEFEQNGADFILDIEEICPCLKPSS